MDGYDMSLLTSFFTFPVFQKSYGEPVPVPESQQGEGQDPSYQISPVWQAALINGTQVGVIMGLIGNGFVTDSLGYRRTLLAALGGLGAVIFLAVFAPNIETLLAAQILCGMSKIADPPVSIYVLHSSKGFRGGFSRPCPSRTQPR
jgi:SP family general alpha glucoside:H+ symporter-like MFS transporter